MAELGKVYLLEPVIVPMTLRLVKVAFRVHLGLKTMSEHLVLDYLMVWVIGVSCRESGLSLRSSLGSLEILVVD
jgi:hypothetical protein